MKDKDICRKELAGEVREYFIKDVGERIDELIFAIAPQRPTEISMGFAILCGELVNVKMVIEREDLIYKESP